jgi:hypothetical protein
MSLQPVQVPQPLLLVPPLLPPLVLRTRNGFFGAKRFSPPGEFDRCRPYTASGRRPSRRRRHPSAT